MAGKGEHRRDELQPSNEVLGPTFRCPSPLPGRRVADRRTSVHDETEVGGDDGVSSDRFTSGRRWRVAARVSSSSTSATAAFVQERRHIVTQPAVTSSGRDVPRSVPRHHDEQVGEPGFDVEEHSPRGGRRRCAPGCGGRRAGGRHCQRCGAVRPSRTPSPRRGRDRTARPRSVGSTVVVFEVGEHGLDPTVDEGFFAQAELAEDRVDVLFDRRLRQVQVARRWPRCLVRAISRSTSSFARRQARGRRGRGQARVAMSASTTCGSSRDPPAANLADGSSRLVDVAEAFLEEVGESAVPSRNTRTRNLLGYWDRTTTPVAGCAD